MKIIYIDMLGYDISFSHIHCIKLANDKRLECKKIGK